MIDATAVFSPSTLTAVVADDSVSMVKWWAQRGVETSISGDDLARVRKERGLKAGHLLAWAVCNRYIERDLPEGWAPRPAGSPLPGWVLP